MTACAPYHGAAAKCSLDACARPSLLQFFVGESGILMRIYIELAIRAFRQLFAYQAAMLAGIFTNSIFGVLLSAVYLALYQSQEPGASVAGFTARQTVTYVWLGQALIAPVMIWGWWEIIMTIRTGAVVTDMLKPISYFGFWLSRDIGRAVGHAVLRGIPTMAIGATVHDLAYPGSPWLWLVFPISVALAVVVSFCFRFMMNLWGFWVLDYRGIAGVSVIVVGVFSGHLLPLAWYPDPVHEVLNLLPFRAIIMLPIEIWLGQVGIAEGLGLQAFWVLGMGLAALWLQSIAERKLVVQGG